MTISKLSTLVSCHWLKQQIMPSAQKLSSNLRVLDSSWDPTPGVDGYNTFYQKEHIPTSLYFDLKEISPAKEGTFHKYSLPEPKVFQEYVEDLGISNHTHVVLYDRMMLRPAFRAWFLFRLFGHERISVLNGGLKHWLINQYPVTKEEPEVESGDFQPNFQRHLLRDFDFMTANIKSKAEQVADSRGAKSFFVTEEDSSGGHIPGSVNIPFNKLTDRDGMFKSEDGLKTLFDNANIDLNKPLVATCQTATTACSLAAAAFILGKEEVPVYNGSFTEWGVRADPQNIVRGKSEE